jgi:CHAT domain-containing protein/Tfp pilus assembly protein PilF
MRPHLPRRVFAFALILRVGVAALLGWPPSALAQTAAFDGMNARIADLAREAKYADALALAQSAAEGARTKLGEETAVYARAIAWLAFLHQVQGRLSEAEPFFRRSLEIYERILPPGHPHIATSLNNLGFQYQITNRLDEAERLYKQALELREQMEPNPHLLIADSLNNLAQVYKHQGRIEEAEPLHRRALAIRSEHLPANDAQIAQSLANLGGTLELQDRMAEAEPLFRRALEARLASQAPNHPEIAGITSKLAQNLYKQRRHQEADPLFAAALDMRYKTQPRDHPDIANTLLDSAQNLIELKRHAEAERRFRAALEIRQKALSPSHPDLAAAFAGTAEALFAQDRAAEALPHIRKAVDIHVARGGVDDLSKQHALDFVRIAWGGYSRDRDKAGRDLLLQSFTVAQRASQTETSAAVTRMAARFSARDPKLAVLIAKRDDVEAEVTRVERELSASLALPTEKRTRSTAVLRESLERHARQLAAVDGQLRDQFPRYFDLVRPDPLTVAEVRRLLKPDEVLVKFLCGERESFVWAITDEAAAWHRLDIGYDGLIGAVAKLREGLDVEELAGKGPGAALFDLGLANDLYKRLLGPIEPVIERKSHLLLVPSGPLTGLPFQLLLRSKPSVPQPSLLQLAVYREADWLIERYALSVLPSVSSLRAIREIAVSPSRPKPLIAFGNPVFGAETVAAAPASGAVGDNTRTTASAKTRSYRSYWRGPAADLELLRKSLPALPETEEELRAVARILSASEQDLKMRAEASETVLKKADLSQYQILYFATHGLVAGEVGGLGEPALALTIPPAATDEDDGLLTASEVAQLKLDADWVVLSACNTAGGGAPGAEALSGLARAFFHAGARAMLVSHWRVVSDAAVRLTTTTAELLQRERGIGRAEALRRAMLAYAKDDKDPWSAYPAFWAPFVVVGEGRG